MRRFIVRNSIHWFYFLFTALCLFGGAAVTNANTYNAPFVKDAAYATDIRTPDDFLGYSLGSRPSTHSEIVSYFEYIAGAKENAVLHRYGKTHEGHDLIYLVISSPENMARLEDIKQNIGKLNDPRKLQSPQEAQPIIQSNPAIAWMSYSIHGNELSSSDAAIWLAYHLAASQDEATRKILSEVVVCIDPLQNPDGRERTLDQIRMLRGKNLNSDVQSSLVDGMWPWGRGNHYFFDLNRDFFILSQPETQARIKNFLEWRPQLFIDSHELGPLDTYLFSPPRPPINKNYPASTLKWGQQFAKDQSQAFNAYGWNYYTREWNEEWYAGYTMWVAYTGAIPILYEQSVTAGGSIKRPDGTVMTFREAVHHQSVSSLANLTTLAQNRVAILQDYYNNKQKTVEPPAAGEIHAYLIVPGDNTSRERLLIEKLLWQGIEVHRATEAFQAKELVDAWGEKTPEKNFLPNTWIIPTQQAQKLVINAILECDPRLPDSFLQEERFHLEKKNESRLYDVSAWSMLNAYGVQAYQCYSTITVPSATVTEMAPAKGSIPSATPSYGYLIDGDEDAARLAVTRLMNRNYKVRVSDESFRNGGQSFSRGSFLLRNIENPGGLRDDLGTIAEETGIAVYNANTGLDLDTYDLGGSHFLLLMLPRVGLFMGDGTHPYSYGFTWHFLDAVYQTPVSPLNIAFLGALDLRPYNVLILPETFGMDNISETELKQLQSWVENGGTLVALGNSVNLIADPKKSISKVHERKDILDQMEVYQEHIKREEDALNATASLKDVYEYNPTVAKGASENSSPSKPDVEKMKRDEGWQRRFSPHGTFMRTTLDPHHFLSFGVKSPLVVMVSTEDVYFAKPPVQTPVRFEKEEQIRVAGLLWPEARKRWAKASYMTRESLGKGQIILFPYEPHERGYYPETSRLLWNAIFLGPGLGTDQPIPW